MKLLMTLLTLSLSAHAVEATYYRAWQGFKKAELTQSQFLGALPSFMQETVDLYRTTHGILSDYLVIIPPKSKPSFVPDELALVSLRSAEEYQQVRATEAGQNYSTRHWDVFERSQSSSAVMVDFTATAPQELEHNKAYDVIGAAVDWSRGHATAYIGLRKQQLPRAQFLQRLAQHIALVKRAFSNKGLKGYVIIAHQDYEVAYMLWNSRSSMERAVAGGAGQVVRADGDKILSPLLFQEFASFMPGQSVSEGEALRPVSQINWVGEAISDAH